MILNILHCLSNMFEAAMLRHVEGHLLVPKEPFTCVCW